MKTTKTTKYIDCTPDFNQMFRAFIRDAKNAGACLPLTIASALPAEMRLAGAVAERAAILRAVQSYLAPITVAINSAVNVAQIEEVRTVMANALAHLDTVASDLEFKRYK